MERSKRFWSLLGVLGISIILHAQTGDAAKAKYPVSKEAKQCISCHEAQSPSFVQEWRLSRHAEKGVDCFTCHKAEKTDPDAMEHNGFTIAVLVTPKDCSKCHPREVKEMTESHHAKAADILNSADNYLGEVVGGPEAVAVGCRQCHGSNIKVLANGKLDTDTWPNTGIGRINPDGSKGSCSACHTRHNFSKAQAREPQTCGKCHLGPDHPQMEVYQESKHGIDYEAFKGRINMHKDKWVVGKDYTAAPTCSTCHMSATPNQPVTHDVGTRISWTLRPPVSKKMENADKRRDSMKDVCASCHSQPFVTGFYKQFDNLVNLYDDKFAKPATAIRQELMDKGKITKANFDDKLDWIYWELWHHEGRRARHGAAMSGPDYAWWHGIYDVAKNFYVEFLPEVKQVAG
ncbi:MAG TPA: multiheme c-type cytochrome, partial [Candidatus Paceibacterota bacterium]